MSTTGYIVLSSIAGIAICLWAMTIWGGWAEKCYEREKDSYWAWCWLRITGVSLTKSNCVRFIKAVSLLGIVLVSVGMFAATLMVLLQK
jgi:hypothetical protein